jgi:hypothetical protein
MCTTSNVEWKDDSRSDLLLIPREHCNHPSILMEVEQIVTEAFLQRVILYCLYVYARYGSKSLVAIFAVTRVQPKGFQGTFQPTSKPYVSLCELYVLSSGAPATCTTHVRIHRG